MFFSCSDLFTLCVMGLHKTSLNFLRRNVSKPQISFALELDTVDKIWFTLPSSLWLKFRKVDLFSKTFGCWNFFRYNFLHCSLLWHLLLLKSYAPFCGLRGKKLFCDGASWVCNYDLFAISNDFCIKAS